MPEIPKHVNSISHFRTDNYRVFLAKPYFQYDLKKEIKWHKKHIKKLRKQKKDPKLFDKEIHNNPDKIRHHNEWVVESIPFHEKILKENEIKLNTIKKLIPKRIYKKINNVSIKHHTSPEYFVFDKKSKEFFFVAEQAEHTMNHWIYLVRDFHKYCDVIVLS